MKPPSLYLSAVARVFAVVSEVEEVVHKSMIGFAPKWHVNTERLHRIVTQEMERNLATAKHVDADGGWLIG